MKGHQLLTVGRTQSHGSHCLQRPPGLCSSRALGPKDALSQPSVSTAAGTRQGSSVCPMVGREPHERQLPRGGPAVISCAVGQAEPRSPTGTVHWGQEGASEQEGLLKANRSDRKEPAGVVADEQWGSHVGWPGYSTQSGCGSGQEAASALCLLCPQRP